MFYPQELMVSLYLFISFSLLLHHNLFLNPQLLSLSLLFFLSLLSIPPPPLPPPPPQSCQDVASFGLRLNGGIWQHSLVSSLAAALFKSIHVYAPNLCTLCVSTSRHELNPGLMRPASPLCTCSEGEGGRRREQKKREI